MDGNTKINYHKYYRGTVYSIKGDTRLSKMKIIFYKQFTDIIIGVVVERTEIIWLNLVCIFFLYAQ